MSSDPRLLPVKNFFERPHIAWITPYIDSQTVHTYLIISVLSISLIFVSAFYLTSPDKSVILFPIFICIEAYWGRANQLSLLNRLTFQINSATIFSFFIFFLSLSHNNADLHTVLFVMVIGMTIAYVISSYGSIRRFQDTYPQGLKTKLYECLDLS